MQGLSRSLVRGLQSSSFGSRLATPVAAPLATQTAVQPFSSKAANIKYFQIYRWDPEDPKKEKPVRPEKLVQDCTGFI